MQNDTSSLRVLVLVNRLFEWSQNFITRELTELNELGVPMTIVARDMRLREDLSPQEKKLEEHYVRVRENPFTPDYLLSFCRLAISCPTCFFSAWRALFSLQHRPSRFFRGLICLFRAAGLAHLVRQRNINLIHAHFLTAAGETALYLSKFTGVPFGATAYAMDIYVDNSGLPGKLRHAAYVNATTLYNERFLARLIPQHPDRVLTLYYGIHILPELLPPLQHEKFTFLAVGRLVEKKGFGYLVAACAILRERGFDFTCEIIGKGPLEEVLKGQIQALHLESLLRLRGYVAPNEMPAVYRKGDVLVAPCVIAENGDVDGLPNVCLEAMNYGLPVISTTISGIPEGVEEGVNGWLTPPNDAPALADAMQKAMQSPHLARMRAASYRMVSEKFDVRKNVLPIRELWEKHRK